MTDAIPKPKRKPRTNGRAMKAKGDNYERSLAAYLKLRLGIDCGRAPLSGGGFVGLSGGADLIGVPGLFVEAKRVEALNFREALRQAEKNILKTRAPELPVVINRRNREAEGEAVVAMRLDDFLKIYASHLSLLGLVKQKQTPPPPEEHPLDHLT